MVPQIERRRSTTVLERSARRHEHCWAAAAFDRTQSAVLEVHGELSRPHVCETGYHRFGPGAWISWRSAQQRRYRKPGRLRHRVSRELESLARVRDHSAHIRALVSTAAQRLLKFC